MLILLDQENVSHHGLTGINSLQKSDKIITFLGKDLRLSNKIKNILETSNINYEIHQGLVGTKNAADYQLISYLTYSIVNNNYDEFLVLSRDTGFDISLKYLREKYPNKRIYRVSCILEYVITDFIESEFLVSRSKATLIYRALLASRYSSLENFYEALKEYKLERVFLEIAPYFTSFQTYLKSLKLDTTVDGESLLNSIKSRILSAKQPLDTYDVLASILDINTLENQMYLKSIRRAIKNSKNFNSFSDRIFSNSTLLEINGLKRCDIPKKIKPYYDTFKISISGKG